MKLMHLKQRKLLVLFFVVLLCFQLGFSTVTQVAAIELEGFEIVIFIANGAVDNELNGVEGLLSYHGASVSIAGLTEIVELGSGATIESDLLISDISDITVYDAIYIPGGNLANALSNDQHTTDLLKAADEAELIIAGVCAGTLVLARAGLIDGRTFTTWPAIVDDLIAAGGTYAGEEYIVYTDGHIITSNPVGSYVTEVTYAISFALGAHCSYTIDQTITKSSNSFEVVFEVEILDYSIVESVSLNLTKEGDEQGTALDTLTLDKVSTNVWSGALVLEKGNYDIEVCIETSSNYMDVIADAKTIKVPEKDSSAPGFTTLLTLFGLLGIPFLSRKR